MALAVVKGKGEKAILHILDNIENGQQTEKRGVYYQNAEKSRSDFADYTTKTQVCNQFSQYKPI